tara:strand:- start:5337 stop:7064 length:1728 start_codon:yes stop_codon:yes gene_type:complete
MKKELILLVAVMTLSAGVGVVLLDREPATEQEEIESEADPQEMNETHDDDHLHPPPEVFVITVDDDGSSISIDGIVQHLHPTEIELQAVVNEQTTLTTIPDLDGLWNFIINTDASDIFDINISATHAPDNTQSTVQHISIVRDQTSSDDSNNTTSNETSSDSNNSSDDTNNSSSDNNTGNQTDNGTDEPTNPTQPTYDSSDMGQFWLDVFRCQSGQNITAVDDLTTTAIETHECSVELTMNETHITIVTNGLPDHDFESTLACSQGNDCTRAQNYEWTIPRSPVNDTTGGHDATNCPEANGDFECAAALGEVAIAINGVPFYGPEDGPGGDAVASQHGAYEEDRQPIELGVCHAHNGQGGTFHYHADANCLHWHPEEGETILDYDVSTPAAVAQNTANGSHSAVIGVAMDGYPIYGLWGYDGQMNVVEMKSSYKLKEGETGYNGIDDYVYVQGLGHLDVCNGHFGPTPDFPDGIYHYHSTMMNGEGDMGFPYFLLCYHGETFLDEGGGDADCSGHGETWGPGIGPPPDGCGGGGGPRTQADYSELVSAIKTPSLSINILSLVVGLLLFAHYLRKN